MAVEGASAVTQVKSPDGQVLVNFRLQPDGAPACTIEYLCEAANQRNLRMLLSPLPGVPPSAGQRAGRYHCQHRHLQSAAQPQRNAPSLEMPLQSAGGQALWLTPL